MNCFARQNAVNCRQNWFTRPIVLEQITPRVRLVARDRTNSDTSLSWAIRSNATLASASVAFGQAVSLVIAMSDCAIVAGQVEYRFNETQPDQATGLGDSVGVFVFAGAVAGEYAIVAVPGIRSDLLITTGTLAFVEIDSTHPDVLAFTTAVTSGIFVTPFGVEITSYDSAIIQERA